MEKKRQSTVIKEAFQADIPKDRSLWPGYYRQRMDLCAACERNTRNGAWGKAVAFAIDKGVKQEQCSICLCYIKEKCWSKNEACGLEEIGEVPKWNRIVVETLEKDMFNLENVTFETCNLDLNETGSEFVAELGTITVSQLAEVDVIVTLSKPLALARVSACGCTQVKTRILDPMKYEINMHLVNPIQEGAFNRLVVASFMEEDILKDESIKLDEKPAHQLLIRIKANVIPDENEGENTEDRPS